MPDDDLERLGRFLRAAGGDPVEVAQRLMGQSGHLEGAGLSGEFKSRMDAFADELSAHREDMRQDQELSTQQLFALSFDSIKAVNQMGDKVSMLEKSLRKLRLVLFLNLTALAFVLSFITRDTWVHVLNQVFNDHEDNPAEGRDDGGHSEIFERQAIFIIRGGINDF